MQARELIPHLFRVEYSKIVSVLCKHFGFEQMEIAEDIASDTFLAAAQRWGMEGIPANPVAWLYHVSKNKAKNYRKRNVVFENKILPGIKKNAQGFYEADIDLSPQNISDSQLQMMFAICHPSIPPESQIGLSLRILCGFGIEEIADAFLTGKDTINKRLFRAKEKLREEKIPIEMPGPAELEARLSAVLTSIYLLFNEGYYSMSSNSTLRSELCAEAMRLCAMLLKNKYCNQPRVNALLALMCFHASRFAARMNEAGEMILYSEQDTGLWDQQLIARGIYFLHASATGDTISKYHLEAEIAYWNTRQEDSIEKWENILQLYNRLLQLEYSPVAALNRTYALSRVSGKAAAIGEAEKLGLVNNHFYFALLGELHAGTDDKKARQYFQHAMILAKTPHDKRAIQKRTDRLGSGPTDGC